MRKKLLIVLIIVLLFTITGCDNTTSKENKSTNNGAPTIKYKDQEIELSTDTNLKDMHYKTNPNYLKTTTVNNLRVIQYDYDSDFVFEIRMAYVENASVKDATKSLTYATTTKKLNNIEYTYGEWEINDQTKGKLYAHQYFHEHNNTTYTICFFTASNMSIYEDLFIKYVTFE